MPNPRRFGKPAQSMDSKAMCGQKVMSGPERREAIKVKTALEDTVYLPNTGSASEKIIRQGAAFMYPEVSNFRESNFKCSLL